MAEKADGRASTEALAPGHRVAILGAGGAIGAACVTAFAGAGSEVWALDANQEAAAKSVHGLKGNHNHAEVDVRDPAALSQLAGEIGVIDSVVYAAGANLDGLVVDTDWTAYRQVLAVNLDGAFHVAAAFGREMISGGRGGSFVFLSSAAGLRGEAGASVYCASKFGVIGLVESFAAEVTAHNIRVNAVCPGNVDSPMLKDVAESIAKRIGAETDLVYSEMAEAGAAKRLVNPQEVAALCLFLASPAAAAITGTALRVDAGASLMT